MCVCVYNALVLVSDCHHAVRFVRNQADADMVHKSWQLDKRLQGPGRADPVSRNRGCRHSIPLT